MIKIIKNIIAQLTKPAVSGNVKNVHKHKWILQYRTGNPLDGKSDVCKCECGQWAVRHYGKAEYHLLDS
jgi:hypothetical protein